MKNRSQDGHGSTKKWMLKKGNDQRTNSAPNVMVSASPGESADTCKALQGSSPSDWGIEGFDPPNIRSLAAKRGNWLSQCHKATLWFHMKPRDLPQIAEAFPHTKDGSLFEDNPENCLGQRTPRSIGRRNTSSLALCLAACASPRDLPRLLRFRTWMDGWMDGSITIW